MNAAIDRSHRGILTKKAEAELKRLYRRVVKALHPDLHPDMEQQKVELFYRAVKAYENGDLDTLRIIDEMVSEETLLATQKNALQALVKEKDRLRNLIDSVRDSINEIKNDYPYILKDLISSEEKIAERRKELEELYEEYQRAIIIYQAKIKEMTR